MHKRTTALPAALVAAVALLGWGWLLGVLVRDAARSNLFEMAQELLAV